VEREYPSWDLLYWCIDLENRRESKFGAGDRLLNRAVKRIVTLTRGSAKLAPYGNRVTVAIDLEDM